MAGEWRASSWGEEISLEYGKALRSHDDTTGRYRVFGSNGPIGWTSEPLAQGPGVILGRKGAYRGVQYSPAPFFVIDTAYYVVPKTDLDMQWLYYAIKHHKLGEVDDGSPIPSTTRSAVYMLDLDVPPPEQQRAIAQILGALDAKIELNQRMNETLEAIARTLFKSWFVDFDPVHAKAKGRDPGLPEGLAALFPDSFESSGLREIPHGWRHGTLGEIAENPHRIVQPSRIDPAAPYIGLGHMPQRSISLSKWGCAEDLESSKFEFAEGEILFGKLRPYFHKVGLAPVDGVCSTDILVVRPKDSIWFGFVLGHVASDEFIAYANSGATGTRMPRTTWQEMARYELIVPPRQVVAQYNDYLEIFTKRVIANIHEARTLASLHETLLPKLISGELRIRNAERFSGGRS